MSKRSFFFAVMLLGFAACAGSGTADDIDGRRGPLGKADAPGLCAPSDCDSQSADGCWCDDLCSYYGDCCSNKVATCDAQPDDICGGFAGFTCDDPGEYCHYDLGDICGAADASGTCQPKPDACITVVEPVCGCDGQTYSNSCFANAAGVSVASLGACKIVCGGFGGIPCPEGLVCVDDPDDGCDVNNGGADCGGICVEPPEPTCCNLDDFPENAFEPVQCCEDGTWQMTGSGSPCASLGMKEGQVCEVEEACCNLDEMPGNNGNPVCFEGATCCSDGSWQCNAGNGSSTCATDGDACDTDPDPDPDSCEGSCGGTADAGCWCDNLCSFYGDCCDDKVDVCGA